MERKKIGFVRSWLVSRNNHHGQREGADHNVLRVGLHAVPECKVLTQSARGLPKQPAGVPTRSEALSGVSSGEVRVGRIAEFRTVRVKPENDRLGLDARRLRRGPYLRWTTLRQADGGPRSPGSTAGPYASHVVHTRTSKVCSAPSRPFIRISPRGLVAKASPMASRVLFEIRI